MAWAGGVDSEVVGPVPVPAMTDRMTAMSASTRASEVRLSGPTHLRMCIRVSTQAGPARSRCCGPARGPWAASGPEEAPRSSATRSGSFASSRRRMASHAHLGTTGRETSWAREVWGPRRHRGPRAGGCGQEELRDSSCDSERTGAESAQRTYISRHRRAGVAGLAATGGTGPARGPLGRRGLRASRRRLRGAARLRAGGRRELCD